MSSAIAAAFTWFIVIFGPPLQGETQTVRVMWIESETSHDPSICGEVVLALKERSDVDEAMCFIGGQDFIRPNFDTFPDGSALFLYKKQTS